MRYAKDNQFTESKTADLSYAINPAIDFIPAQQKDADTSSLESRRRILMYDLAKENKRVAVHHHERQQLSQAYEKLAADINQMELYEREKATKELQRLKTQLASYPEIEDNAGKIRLQIQALKAKPAAEPEPVKVSGYINILQL